MSGPDIKAERVPDAELEQRFAALTEPLNDMEAVREAARCLFCHDAPCTRACPSDIDIPGFIRKIASGNTRGAAETILAENIMGATCARVCPVEELCEQVCVKNTGEHRPVEIGQLQRHATDFLETHQIQPYRAGPPTGKHVAVVGGGPAGLACAHRLALHGHNVTIFEARDKLGGLNEYGIAAYKLPDQRAAREVRFIIDVGNIAVQTGARLGSDIDLDTLREKFDAVFLGLGHNTVNTLGLPGTELTGVYNAVDYIERIRQEPLASLPVGRRVVVIGGGNTAIDISVQVARLGAEDVTLVYRRGTEAMSATEHERRLAQQNNVRIRTHARPVRIGSEAGHLQSVTFEYTTDEGGQLQGTGETFSLPADQLFLAIGQAFETSPFQGSKAPETVNGRIRTGHDGQTSLSNVWAGGDCAPGQDLTVAAVQDGKRAAGSIHRYLVPLESDPGKTSHG